MRLNFTRGVEACGALTLSCFILKVGKSQQGQLTYCPCCIAVASVVAVSLIQLLNANLSVKPLT